MSPEPVQNLLKKQVYSYSNRNLNNITSIAIEPLSIEEQDSLVKAYSDVIDPNYRLWFIKQLKRCGKTKFVEAGEKARKYGRGNGNQLFAHLLS